MTPTTHCNTIDIHKVTTPAIHLASSKQLLRSKCFNRDALDSNRATSNIPFAIVFLVLYSIVMVCQKPFPSMVIKDPDKKKE